MISNYCNSCFLWSNASVGPSQKYASQRGLLRSKHPKCVFLASHDLLVNDYQPTNRANRAVFRGLYRLSVDVAQPDRAGTAHGVSWYDASLGFVGQAIGNDGEYLLVL